MTNKSIESIGVRELPFTVAIRENYKFPVGTTLSKTKMKEEFKERMKRKYYVHDYIMTNTLEPYNCLSNRWGSDVIPDIINKPLRINKLSLRITDITIEHEMTYNSYDTREASTRTIVSGTVTAKGKVLAYSYKKRKRSRIIDGDYVFDSEVMRRALADVDRYDWSTINDEG